jgi:hypothetical protein
MPTFDATTAAATPVEDTGPVAVAAADELERAEAEGLT